MELFDQSGAAIYVDMYGDDWRSIDAASSPVIERMGLRGRAASEAFRCVLGQVVDDGPFQGTPVMRCPTCDVLFEGWPHGFDNQPGPPPFTPEPATFLRWRKLDDAERVDVVERALATVGTRQSDLDQAKP